MADDVNYAHIDPLSWLAGCSGHSPHLAGHRRPIRDWVVCLFVGSCIASYSFNQTDLHLINRRWHTRLWCTVHTGRRWRRGRVCRRCPFLSDDIFAEQWPTLHGLVPVLNSFSVIFLPTILITWKCDYPHSTVPRIFLYVNIFMKLPIASHKLTLQ